MEHLKELAEVIETRRPACEKLEKHWQGEAPHVFLSKDSADGLDNRLSKLAVNFPALVVESRVDRMKLKGWRAAGDTTLSQKLLDLAEQTGLQSLAELVHTNHQLYAAAYVTVWADRTTGAPVVTLDSALTAAVKVDRATGERLAALRVWKDGETSHRVYYTPETITRQVCNDDTGQVWKNNGPIIRNPLRAVPVVPFIRRTSIDDTHGTSAVAQVLDLTAALAKVLQDAMVTSEYFAKPRRWATGLEIVEDDEGNPIDPFGKKRFLQSEDPDTKFGQLAGSGPDTYSGLVATLTQQIGSLTGLPPHYLGLHGDQPANADGVRAAETQLVMRVYSELQMLSRPWSEVARLLLAVEEAKPLREVGNMITEWESPEIRTMSQASDSALKLRTIGVPLEELLSDPLDYAPHKVRAIMSQYRQEQTQIGGNQQ